MTYIVHISDSCPLTPKVKEVFALRSSGMTEKKVAAVLGKQLKTVNRQSEELLSFLGVSSLAEAMCLAIDEGWLVVEHVGARVFRRFVMVFFCLGMFYQGVVFDVAMDLRRVRLSRTVRVSRSGRSLGS